MNEKSIYIYIYISCLLDFKCDDLLSFTIPSFPCTRIFLGWMYQQMTFQACHNATNFTTDLALALMNVLMQCSRLDMCAHMAFKTSKWETYVEYFTGDVVTLWTWCWSLFALYKLIISKRRTEHGCFQRILYPHESICSTDFYLVPFFPISQLICWILWHVFTKSLNLFFGFDAFLFLHTFHQKNSCFVRWLSSIRTIWPAQQRQFFTTMDSMPSTL